MPAWYDDIFYFTCKVLLAIRSHFMLIYYGLVQKDETSQNPTIRIFYKYFATLWLFIRCRAP